MAIRVSPGSGATVATEIIAGANYQQIKVVDGTPTSTNTWTINADGSALFSTNNLTSLASGTQVLANQNGTWNVNITGLVSLASGTKIQTLEQNLISLASGTHVITDAGTNTSTANLDVALSTRTKPADQQHTLLDNLVSLASGQLISINDGGNSITVDGTFWQTTQPVSFSNPTVFIGSAPTLFAVVNTSAPGTQAVTFDQVVSLASGTKILSYEQNLISLASGTAIIANQGGNWNVGITGLVSLASGTSVLTAFSGVISLASGQLISINDGGNSITVDGTVSAQQSGAWGVGASLATTQTIGSLNSLASIYGKVDIINAPTLTVNTHAVSQSGAWGVGASLATTQVIGSLNSLASIYGVVGISGTPTVSLSGLVSLASGTNILTSFSGVISLASGQTILTKEQNLISLASGTNVLTTQSGTWNVGVTGLISLASGTSVLTSFSGVISLASGQLISINDGGNSITVDGTVNSAQSGNWDIRSVLSIASIYGKVDLISAPTLFVVVNTGTVNLNSGSTVNVMNFPATQPVSFSNPTVFIGSSPTLFAVVNTGALGTQPVSFDQLVSLASGTNVLVKNLVSIASINGKVDVGSVTNLASIASIYGNVQLVSTPTLFAVVNTGTVNLNSGSTVNVMNFPATQPVSFSNPTVFIGSSPTLFAVVNTSAPGTQSVTFDQLVSLASGTKILSYEQNLISLASGTTVLVNNLVSVASINGLVDVKQNGNWYLGASLATTTVIGSLNSLASVYGSVGIATGANFIGLASTIPAFQALTANYTSFATILSASGAASIFAPPNNNRFVLKDIILGSLGNNEVNIQSGATTVLIPFISLATMGGYISNFGESGLRGKALNDAFVVNKNSTATLSIFVTVRFDTT